SRIGRCGWITSFLRSNASTGAAIVRCLVSRDQPSEGSFPRRSFQGRGWFGTLTTAQGRKDSRALGCKAQALQFDATAVRLQQVRGEATEGTRRMPRRQGPMKDGASADT